MFRSDKFLMLFGFRVSATWCDESDILPPVVDVLDAAPGPVSSALPFLFSMSVGTTLAPRFPRQL